jgi:hypothetical protein
MKLTTQRIKFITQFLSYMRPEGGAGQQWFEDRYINTIPNTWQDAVGNTHLDLRMDKTNRTLFVAHTDTVHKNDGRQQPMVNAHMMTCNLADTQATCLGADDGAGIMVLLHLIKNNVPAYYIFTRGEERGGIGATHLVKTYPHLLAQFDRAIAFDRKGTSSVISHQGWARCCSEAFAETLSDRLSTDTLMYAPDDGGVYTDTAEFVDIIPECTNISVGYLHEHTTKESLDLQHLVDLMDQVVCIDWDALPTERDPSVKEPLLRYDPHAAAYDVGTWYRPEPVTNSHGYDWWDDIDEYNAAVFEAVCNAEDGYTDELMWITAEAVMSNDPEVIYKRIWNAQPSRTLLKAVRKDVDRAYDMDGTYEALNKFYVALLDEQALLTKCVHHAH